MKGRIQWKILKMGQEFMVGKRWDSRRKTMEVTVLSSVQLLIKKLGGTVTSLLWEPKAGRS